MYIVAEFGSPTEERLIIMGLENGIRVYKLKDCDNINRICTQYTPKPWILVHLPSTGLIGVVPDSDVTSIKFYNALRGNEIATLQVPTPILTVKINKSIVIACLLNTINVYRQNDLSMCNEITTGTNPRGVCALTRTKNTPENDPLCLIAFPGKSSIGDVKIYDNSNMTLRLVIKAHIEPLAALAFSEDGSKLATASESGGEICVYSTFCGDKIQELIRGVMRPAEIYCLNFSHCGRFLCSSSNTETIHVFQLQEQTSGYIDWVKRLVYSSMMMFQDGRAFAKAYLPQGGHKSQVSIAEFGGKLWLVAITNSASVYLYRFNPRCGGLLSLHRKFSLK